MRGELVLVRTTFENTEDAGRLARLALEERLAACVQFHPVSSMYHWQGRLETAEEVCWTAKTCPELAQPLMDFIKRHHPYEVPEILVLPVAKCLPEYGAWLDAETNAI
ncbi:MAG: divalent-cation tolerance protein CutA [Kiritimatiellia bacterium]|nr:divalent-cation tolerance protein CutA [Lentisphaerota bacterium]